ncbi:MAG: hypothetical protein RLZZ245_3907 [Verrucomicrobiota bacterium]|jgi:hypothetical protein
MKSPTDTENTAGSDCQERLVSLLLEIDAAKKKVAELRKKIADAKKMGRRKKDKAEYGPGSKRFVIAHAVLIDGKTIKEAAKIAQTGPVNARHLMHDYCRRMNPEVYRSGYHHNVYEGGWENDCPPLLKWLREHAPKFFQANA